MTQARPHPVASIRWLDAGPAGCVGSIVRKSATSAPARRRRRAPVFLAELCRRLVANGAQRIYLFGSYARGEADVDSDVDLVVIQDTPMPFFDRLRAAWACAEPDWPVDILVYTPAEFEAMQREGNAFAETVAAEGVVLCGKEQPD